MSGLNLIPKGSLAHHAAELAERDALYRSGLRQARNLVESARAFRAIQHSAYHAELLTVAADYRRFVVRRRKGKS